MSPTRPRVATIPLLFALALLLAAPVSAALGAGGGGKLRGELPAVLDGAGPDELVPVSIVLGDQLSGERLRTLGADLTDPAARRRVRAAALKEHAAATQLRLRARLGEAERAGQARHLRFLWIGNIVAAELTPDLVRQVAALPEVDHVNWAPKVDVFLGQRASVDPAPTSLLDRLLAPAGPGAGTGAGAGIDAEIECGVSLMRAPDVWNDFNNTGQGAVIAVIDSGVCWSHPDIANQIWVNPGEDLDGDGVVMDADDQNGIDDDGNGYIDDLIGYDIDNGDNDPNDDNSHGSHVAGTIAGDGTGGFQAGMAPDARIMVLRVGLQFSDEPDVWEAMQYAADNGADSISMSLGWPHNQNPDRATWRTNCENTIDLGTAMVIAAGNEGSGSEPDNVRTPGDVPRVITIGAVNCSDQIASFSSRGPVTWQDVPEYGDFPWPPGLIKPDVSGPGVDTRSHSFCSGYSYKSGTSMATPHVAGAVALMKSANPGLTHDDLKAILEDTSVDLGDPGKDNVYGSGRVDAYEAVLQSATPDGRVSIREQRATCDSLLHVTLSDTDLTGLGTYDVTLTSGTEPGGEVVTLTETSATSGVFKGELSTAAGAPAADGLLQVADGDIAVAHYTDADDGKGGTNVEKTDQTDIDCRPPLISAVDATDIDNTSATIRWTTDENSDSLVHYGDQRPPSLNASSGGLVTSHAVPLGGLAECTVYYYDVSSADALSNRATDDNNGQYYQFETWGNFADIGIAPCHQGQVTLDRTIYACSDVVTVAVTDIDLNTDSAAVETVAVVVSSTTEPGGETITLTEVSANSARFEGTIGLASGPAIPADGLLQASDTDLITATYHDADDGSGVPRIDSKTADADCAAAVISGVKVTRLTQTWAEVEWTTSEPATSRVEWGPDPALGSVTEDAALVTAHKVFLHGFDACQSVFFTVGGADAYGNDVTVDTGNGPFSFSTQEIPGLYFYDGFENGPGTWVLGSEWEVGTPEGRGGSSGPADPAAAFSGAGALGLDLTGQGSYPGDYEPTTGSSATSDRIPCSGCSNTELIFRRHLNVGGADTAQIAVISSGKDIVWNNAGATVSETSWTEQRYDLSAYADGKPFIQLAFSIDADSTGQYSGWNIDELVLKDGTLPDYVSCGNCGAPPSSAGLSSATDPDACAAGGIELAWDPATSWGTGGGGSYAVYRGATADFTPGPSNRVAAGLTATTYTDAAAPVDQQVWYLVRAENDETCSGGPANGGVMDDNLVRLPATETVTRPPADSVGTSVRVEAINAAHARVSWQAAANASSYIVRRAESPDMSGAIDLGQTAGTFLEDADALANAKNYFYRVIALNPCGQQTP